MVFKWRFYKDGLLNEVMRLTLEGEHNLNFDFSRFAPMATPSRSMRPSGFAVAPFKFSRQKAKF